MAYLVSSPPVVRYDLNDIWGEPISASGGRHSRHLYTSASQPLLSQAAASSGGYEASHGSTYPPFSPTSIKTSDTASFTTTEDDAASSTFLLKPQSHVTSAKHSAAYPRLSISVITFILLALGVSLCTIGTLTLQRGLQTQQAQYGTQQAKGRMPGFPLRMGSCKELRMVNQGAHIVLNVIGVLILGFSSFLQQLLTSPLFSRAFTRQAWTTSTFGNNSVGRLFRVGTAVSIFGWIGLVITSLPAHAFINSLVTYTRMVPSANGWTSGAYPNSATPQKPWPSDPNSSIADSNSSYPLGTRVLVALDQCTVLDYVTYQDTTTVDPVLIVSDFNLLWKWFDTYTGDWVSVITANQKNYPNFTAECHANVYDSMCFLSIRPEPALVVGLFCVLKALIVAWILWKDPHFSEPSISSIGDAVLAVHRAGEQIAGKSLVGFTRRKTHPGGMKYQTFRMRRLSMLRVGDWFAYFYWLLSVCAAGALFGLIIGDSIGEMFKLGFGAVGFDWFSIPDTAGFASLATMAIANSPQFWLSSAYFTYSSAITQIYQEYEWQKFYMRSTHLRTTIQHPFLRTKKTRWLQLPLLASASLMALGGIMHWLVSLTASITDIISDGAHSSTLVITPEPLFVLVIVAGCLVLGITIFYCMRLKYKMPILNNSLGVLAAAVPTGALMPELMWAAQKKEAGEDHARCGLMSSGEHPQVGEYYR
ncbi:hypothetical protein T439DRAFT_351645 [Meredithblackwellia eburnea MCA 4105]